ncbi:MAG: hypothetical protein OEV78_13020, partial [Spirochaetia bacterium]|nr:hypothetical protein [Spirochaetia bacterium]
IPDSKGFALSAESFKIELYDRSMNKIDYADMPYALREGYFDPLIKKTASMNRRLKLNGQPDSGWYTSKIECLWAICQSSFYNASPGYKNEASGPVIFKSMEINSDQTFSAAFSGSINNCINKTDYTVFNKTGNVPIENIFLQKSSNKLTFQINGAGDQLQSYEIRSRSFNEFMANSILYVSPNIFMGTDSGLSISRDNGLTFQDLYVNGNENQKVYKIVLDSATSLIYIAASNGLFFTSDNGLTFQKIQITASLLSNIVFNVAINTGFIVAAAGDGLYIADKSLLNFQKILLMPIYSIYFTDTLLLAGGNNLVFRFFSPFTASPVIISLNGVVHDIKLLGSTYFLTATSGLYTSSDGINYFPAYVGIFSNKVPGLTAQDSMNNPLILSHDQISGIYPAGVQTFDMRLNQKSINNNSLAVSGLNFLVAGDYGFLTGSSLDLLSNINSFTCSVEQTLPAGSLVFNGYGTFADRQPATLLLNEMSLVNSDGKDWLEYYVTSSGTLKNISIEYLEADSFEIIFGFPDMYVNAGDVIMIYLESALDQNKTIGNDISFVRSTPYKFYSTHININRGDGILMVRKNNDIEDVLYYSNYDGNISSGFAHGLYEVYFNSSMQNLLTKPLPFPVNGWNDAEVQNSGVKIPDLGGSRAIVRTSLFQNIWKVESIPTPGVK